MRFRIRKKAASSSAALAAAAEGSMPASSTAAAAAGAGSADGGGGAMIAASPDRYGTQNGGSKDESFFETRPWLDSDSEDDFQSVRGDFTPSRGSTPDHQMQTFAARLSVDRPEPSPTDKKQRLLELLQEKQQYDDEHDGATDAGSETGNGIVHAEEHLNPAGKVQKAKKPTKPGCFPFSAWKLSFKSCWKKKKEQKDL